MKKTWLTLILIFVLAAGLRLVKITKYPLSLNWDEAAFAYNAYSVLQTGKDEYGEVLPLQFKSVGDYKNPMYVYLLVPIIKAGGLNVLTTRIPPAVLGALTIPLLYIIAWTLFKNRLLATISGVLLAISPWHLQFTRAGADVGVSSFFVVLGICLFLRKKYLTGVASLIGSMYSYFADKMFAPIMLLFLAWQQKENIYKHKSKVIAAVLVGILLSMPFLVSTLSPGHKNKVFITTLLSYKVPEEILKKLKAEDGSVWYGAFHNPIVEYGYMMIDRYLNHFSPSFLFIKGLEDNRQRILGMGMMYWSDVVLLVFGLGMMVKNIKNKNWRLVLVWLLIAPLPAVITRDPVHARRAFNMIYPLIILISYGLIELLKQKMVVKMVFGGFFLWSVGLYFLSYYVFTPLVTYKGSAGWQYGYKQLVEFVSPIKGQYAKIVIDTSYQGPYIFFLFYEKYPPLRYQQQAKLAGVEGLALGEGVGYDNYNFRPIFWPGDRGNKKTLYAGPPERIPLQDIDPKSAKLLKTLYFPDGTEAFRVVETF